MRELERGCWALIAVLGASACSASRPTSPPSIEGRWVTPERTLEFLPCGLLVEDFDLVRESAVGEAKTELHVSAGTYRLEKNNLVVYEMTSVGRGPYPNRDNFVWSVDDARKKLALDKNGVFVFTRDESVLSPARKALVGLWKRVDPQAGDGLDSGLVFTAGGIHVVVGKSSPWDPQSPSDCALAWRTDGNRATDLLCLAARYELTDDHTLEETSPTPNDPAKVRHRTRRVEINGDDLTIHAADGAPRAYRRVCAGVPVRASRLDLAAWEAVK